MYDDNLMLLPQFIIILQPQQGGDCFLLRRAALSRLFKRRADIGVIHLNLRLGARGAHHKRAAVGKKE